MIATHGGGAYGRPFMDDGSFSGDSERSFLTCWRGQNGLAWQLYARIGSVLLGTLAVVGMLTVVQG